MSVVSDGFKFERLLRIGQKKVEIVILVPLIAQKLLIFQHSKYS